MNQCVLFILFFLIPSLTLSSCTTNASPPTVEELSDSSQTTAVSHPSAPLNLSGNTVEVWNKLQHTSTIRLKELQKYSTNTEEVAWIKLALIHKRFYGNTQTLASALLKWKQLFPNHPGQTLIAKDTVLQNLIASKNPQKIAILLPQQGSYAASGQRIKEGFIQAYYENKAKSGNQMVKFYDTSQSQQLAEVYHQAQIEGADFILGPLSKEEVQSLNRIKSSSIPVITLNYSDEMLTQNLYQFGLLPEDESHQIANKAHEAGLSKALIIAPENGWGKRLVSAFKKSWEALDGQIQDSWFYGSPSTFNQAAARLLKVNPVLDKALMKENNDKNMLAQQRRQDFDVIFLFAQAKEARIIVPLLKFYYAGDIPIYANSSVYTGKKNVSYNEDLNNVIVCDIPWKVQSKKGYEELAQAERLFAVGQDAYLLTQTLTQLKFLPHFPVYGKTGALSLNDSNQIHRRLPCMSIKNGII